MNKKIKSFLKYYWSLIVLILLIGGLGYNWKYQINHTKDLLNNGFRTKGVSSKKGKNLIWEFTVDGEKITKVKSKPFKGVWNSEQFEVAYNPNDFKDIAIDYSKFILSENYLQTKSTDISKNWWNSKNVFFKYEIGNKIYERIQRVNEETIFDVTKNYSVKYRSDTPEIAYIFLDSIIK